MTRFTTDFSERLKHYGIDQAEKNQKAEAPDENVLHWDDRRSPFKVQKVSSSCLDELKSMVGNPDSIFANGEAKEPENCKKLGAQKSLTKDQVGEAAHAYVFGNSAPMKSHKAFLESTLGNIELHVTTDETIVIDKVIEVSGTVPKVISTGHLIFKPGGQIRNIGVLTINASVIVNDN